MQLHKVVMNNPRQKGSFSLHHTHGRHATIFYTQKDCQKELEANIQETQLRTTPTEFQFYLQNCFQLSLLREEKVEAL